MYGCDITVDKQCTAVSKQMTRYVRLSHKSWQAMNGCAITVDKLCNADINQ